MIKEILHIIIYIYFTIINTCGYIKSKKIHNLLFTIFFGTELVREYLLERYISHNVNMAVGVFELIAFVAAVILYFHSGIKEDNYKNSL